uniref:RNA-directed DNA polymerase n=1 Tax=Phlebotomus papatasi TaxID=29031 RepID=A0A1B0DGR2_PHLPP
MDQTQATTSTAFDSTQVNQIQAKWRNNSDKEECSRCGRSGHNGKDSKCPALEKKCAKCQLRGHFAIKCRTRRPIKLTQEGPENSTKSEKKSITSFIYNIGDGDEYIWCKVGGVLIEMMIDSGASQNIIDEHTWQYMKKNGIEMQNVMEETQKVLRAYAQSEPLKIIKVFKTNISVTGGSQDMGKEAVFYVIQGGSQPLLGKATAKELGVLVLGLPSTRETMIGQVKDSRITTFPKVKGVKIVIPIDERVSPVSQHARRPPIALLDKVEEKLEELQKLDIIEPVNEHSDWVSPIVVIPKDNGDIRICVDMRQVNKAIKRENHMMPVMIYRKGISNIADPLSRLSVSTEKVNSDEGNDFMVRAIVESAAVDVSEIEKASKEDSEMQAIRQALHTGVWSNILLKAYHPFKLELASAGDIVMRGSKLVVPEGLRSRMLQLTHEGHPGETLMKQRLRERVWWPGTDSDSVKVVRSCEGCILVSAPNKPEPMQRRALPSGPCIDLAMDFMSIPSGEHLLVVVDYFSRYKEVEIMHRITARETIERLDKIFTHLERLRWILEEYCLKKGIHLNNTIPYWPQQNGEVERQNRSLLKRIKISHNLDRDWRKDLQDYLMCYYTTPHTTTGKTPTELCYGRTIRGKIPSLKDIETAPPEADFSDRDKRLKEKGKELEDTRRGARESDIEVGDVVLMKNLLPGNKLQATFGATKYVVLKRSGGAAIVRDDTSGKQYERNVAHLKKVVVSAESSTIPVEIVPEPEPVEEQPVEKISRKRTIPRKSQDFVVPSLNQKH